jgi:hypothetical protein
LPHHHLLLFYMLLECLHHSPCTFSSEKEVEYITIALS